MERVAFAWDGGTVSGARHLPRPGAGTWLVLAHGAGGNLDTPQLVRIAEALAERGIGVVRFNFPYAERGRKSPGSPAEAIACFRAVAADVVRDASRLLIGGKSYGGRMASHLAAEGHPVDGLAFFGYPLHAPGKVDRLRDAHLREIHAPMLFLQGTRDPFARLDLIEKTVASLPATTLRIVEGADHSFVVPGRQQPDVIVELTAAVDGWIQDAVR